MKVLEFLKSLLSWIWFILTLPFILIFTDKMLGGAGGLEGDMDYDMFYSMKFSTTGKISYIFTQDIK